MDDILGQCRVGKRVFRKRQSRRYGENLRIGHGFTDTDESSAFRKVLGGIGSNWQTGCYLRGLRNRIQSRGYYISNCVCYVNVKFLAETGEQ